MSGPLVYHNLTQCLGGRMVYFRSTDVEQRNYHRLLWSVPDEWLYLFSQQRSIVVVDKSTHRRGKVERIFLPVLSDLLRHYYTGQEPINKQLKEHYVVARTVVDNDNSLRTKLCFWKGRIRQAPVVKGHTIHVSRESNPLGVKQ